MAKDVKKLFRSNE